MSVLTNSKFKILWFDIVFDMITAMVSFKCSNLNIWVWYEHCNFLFNIRNPVSILILMFVRICLCDAILYTWFGKKWKRLKKFWGWKICLVYAHFFKHLSLSMLISFMLIKKRSVPIGNKNILNRRIRNIYITIKNNLSQFKNVQVKHRDRMVREMVVRCKTIYPAGKCRL